MVDSHSLQNPLKLVTFEAHGTPKWSTQTHQNGSKQPSVFLKGVGGMAKPLNLVYTFPGLVRSNFVDFEFHMAFSGVGTGPIGLVAPLKFKRLDSQPTKSNMGPVSIDVHIC